jgi:hypothetical protein
VHTKASQNEEESCQKLTREKRQEKVGRPCVLDVHQCISFIDFIHEGCVGLTAEDYEKFLSFVLCVKHNIPCVTCNTIIYSLYVSVFVVTLYAHATATFEVHILKFCIVVNNKVLVATKIQAIS